MKITLQKATLVFDILNKLILGDKMSSDAKYAITRIQIELKPLASSYRDALDLASQRLRPDGFETIATKIQKREPLTLNEQQVFLKYNTDVENCIKEEVEREIELKSTPLNDIMMKELIDCNNIAIADVITLHETIVE